MQPTKAMNQAAIPSCLLCSCPDCFPHIFLLQECCFLLAILPPFQCLVTITPALSTEGKLPPLCPGVPPPHTHGCCPKSSWEMGIFGCRGTGRACSHVPFVLLGLARQISHFTTLLKEPVLPQHSSPRLPSLFQHPHCPWDVVLQWLQMHLWAPQSSFFLREKENSD